MTYPQLVMASSFVQVFLGLLRQRMLYAIVGFVDFLFVRLVVAGFAPVMVDELTVISASAWIIARVFVKLHRGKCYRRNLPAVGAVRVVGKIEHEPGLVFPAKFYSFMLV